MKTKVSCDGQLFQSNIITHLRAFWPNVCLQWRRILSVCVCVRMRRAQMCLHSFIHSIVMLYSIKASHTYVCAVCAYVSLNPRLCACEFERVFVREILLFLSLLQNSANQYTRNTIRYAYRLFFILWPWTASHSNHVCQTLSTKTSDFGGEYAKAPKPIVNNTQILKNFQLWHYDYESSTAQGIQKKQVVLHWFNVNFIELSNTFYHSNAIR